MGKEEMTIYQGKDRRMVYGCIDDKPHEYYYMPEKDKMCVKCTRCPLSIEAKRSEDKKKINDWR